MKTRHLNDEKHKFQTSVLVRLVFDCAHGRFDGWHCRLEGLEIAKLSDPTEIGEKEASKMENEMINEPGILTEVKVSIRAMLEDIRKDAPKSREMSLVITKLEEAEMWLLRHQAVAE